MVHTHTTQLLFKKRTFVCLCQAKLMMYKYLVDIFFLQQFILIIFLLLHVYLSYIYRIATIQIYIKESHFSALVNCFILNSFTYTIHKVYALNKFLLLILLKWKQATKKKKKKKQIQYNKIMIFFVFHFIQIGIFFFLFRKSFSFWIFAISHAYEC